MIPKELLEFSYKLRAHGIKQIELAEHMKLSTTYVNEVINGKRPWERAIVRFDDALNQLIDTKQKNSSSNGVIK